MTYKGALTKSLTLKKKKREKQSNRKWVQDINRQVTDETYEKFTSSQENTNQNKHKIIRYNQQLKNLKRALTSAGDRGIGKAYSFTGTI